VGILLNNVFQNAQVASDSTFARRRPPFLEGHSGQFDGILFGGNKLGARALPGPCVTILGSSEAACS
jgi:hypothetical protein